MADDHITIDPATVFDNVGDRQIEFSGDASGERYAFALRYDVLEALSGGVPDRPLPVFHRHLARIQAMAAVALARDADQEMVVISENDLS